ncbi:MAG TPA: glycosyltransferase [Actinoplanes sp.]|jgi:UDP-N-acetylglucosamine transferase subunit ALG13
MARILVTVGMGRRPFDRLVQAVEPLCAYHDVFVQTGPSQVVPPCPHAPFVPLDELQRRLAEADIVITHAGSTVRLVQRLGRVPIAVARHAERGEAEDDNQVRYLQAEAETGRVYAVWEAERLAEAVAAHTAAAHRLLARPLPPPVPDDHLIAVLDGVCDRLIRRPAGRRPA